MKCRKILTIIFLVCSIAQVVNAQTVVRYLEIYQDDKVVFSRAINEIDSVKFTVKHSGEVIYDSPVYIIGDYNNWDDKFEYPTYVMRPSTVNGGSYTFTGWFDKEQGYRLMNAMYDWNTVWGLDEYPILKSSIESSIIYVPESGYYTINICKGTKDGTITPVADASFTEYKTMELVGDFNFWGEKDPVYFTQLVPHIWFADNVVITAETQVKIRVDSSWVPSWGIPASCEPDFYTYFLAEIKNDAGCLLLPIGTYDIVFNDIDGCVYIYVR